MATTDTAKNALAKTSDKAPTTAVDTLAALIRSMAPEIAKAVPAHMKPDRMARIATTMVRATPRLAECTAPSFLGALMTCAQLGLEPGPLGLAWIIPYKNTDTNKLEAQFQLGYKGIIELARRSGHLGKIVARTVYAAEVAAGQFTVEYDGAVEHVRHVPILLEERGAPVLYYAAARLDNGEELFTALRPIDVEERHRKRSKSPNSPAWRNDYERMSWKSCVVEMRWMLPQSAELEMAMGQDGRTRTDIDPSVLELPAASDFIDSTAEDVTEESTAGPATVDKAVEGPGPEQPAPTGTGWPKARKPADAKPEPDGEATS